MGLSAFCQTTWQLFICYGLLIGFGFSFCYLPTLSNIGQVLYHILHPSIIIIIIIITIICNSNHSNLNQWFVKYRGLATGIAVSGSGFGTLILPIVANYLQEQVNII
jgi:MFS family permease